MVEEKGDGTSVDQLKENDMYKEFLDDSFNAREYANTVIEGHLIGEALSKLSIGIELLDKDLLKQVAEHHEDLLSQATGIETLEGVLQSITARCQSLVKSVQRIRMQVVEPYNRISSRTKQLRRLQTTCEYLRRIIRVVAVSRRLEAQLKGGQREITKAAQSLNELEYILDGYDLNGIEIVEKDLDQMKVARIEVNKQSKEMLRHGLNTQNQSVIGTSLQVFQNLGSLYPEVNAVIELSTRSVEKYLKESFDITKLMSKQGVGTISASGRTSATMSGMASSWSSGLWDNLELLTNNLFALCQKVYLLEKVLSKKRDPATHVSFITTFSELATACLFDVIKEFIDKGESVGALYVDLTKAFDTVGHSLLLKQLQEYGVLGTEVEWFTNYLYNRIQGEGRSTLFSGFWDSICSALRSNFDQGSQESAHLKQALEGEYPKLLQLFNDFWTKVDEMMDKKVSPQAKFQQNYKSNEILIGFNNSELDPLQNLKSCLKPFETAYLSRSLSRLFDPINLVFPEGTNSVPSKDDLTNIVKVIASELDVASVDEHLMLMVTKSISKTVKLYVNKCEHLVESTAEASQLSGGLTNSQIRNASIVNSLDQLRTGLCELLPNLVYPPQEVVSILDESISSIASFMDIAMSFLLRSIMASLENKMSRMHSENYNISTQDFQETQDTQPCSKYVADIQGFLARMQSDYLSLYTCQEFLQERLEMLTARLLELFVRHACLIRDLSEGGRLKISVDMAQLELSLTPLCRRFEEIGHAYKQYRAFRPLLYQGIEDIPNNPSLGDSLPYSTALHFLFSKAPPQLVSPHTVNGWTITQYSEWLDEHTSENERINVVRNALNSYEKKIDNNPSLKQTTAPVYDVMKLVIQRALSNEST